MAKRIAISRWRVAERASIRLATFTQANEKHKYNHGHEEQQRRSEFFA